MIITLSPQRSDAPITITTAGDVITINGVALDLSGVAEGAVLDRATAGFPWLTSNVTRVGGVLHFALILPHGAAAPDETLFPAPIHVTGDGPVSLPPFEIEEN